MAEKKVLWLTGEKDPYTNQYEGALIDADQVYDGVNLYDDTIRAWIKKGTIPYHKVGRLYKFKVSEVDAWIESGASADAVKKDKTEGIDHE